MKLGLFAAALAIVIADAAYFLTSAEPVARQHDLQRGARIYADYCTSSIHPSELRLKNWKGILFESR